MTNQQIGKTVLTACYTSDEPQTKWGEQSSDMVDDHGDSNGT